MNVSRSKILCPAFSGYSVGAGNFLSPVTVEVVGGAPQYKQKGKVGATWWAVCHGCLLLREKFFVFCWTFVDYLVTVCVWDVQVFIFKIDRNWLQVVSQVSGTEVRGSCLALAACIQNSGIFSILCMCSCSWDLTLAPACVPSTWMLMVCRIWWWALPWQQASSEKKEEYMCTSIRGRWEHTHVLEMDGNDKILSLYAYFHT